MEDRGLKIVNEKRGKIVVGLMSGTAVDGIDAVRAVVRRARIPVESVDLIGCHGQTVHHLPQPVRIAGKRIRATLQLGDPSALATLTGIPTVGNFRIADMAVGGQGAPLVPYFDWLMFRSDRASRILLNIGGIANITVPSCRMFSGRRHSLRYRSGEHARGWSDETTLWPTL
jgi:1,6-anhydro-N-acetylmuramate kinase